MKPAIFQNYYGGLLNMIKFNCKGPYDNKARPWQGYISKLVYFGSHMEISIMLPQPVTADVCKTQSGFFAYFACYECGVNLCSLFDISGAADRLSAIFSEKDAITVAHAIGKVGSLLSKPRRRRHAAAAQGMDGLPF
jgi:hypothetical protein